VLCQHAVVEPSVAILQSDQIDILIQVVLIAAEVLQHTFNLLLLTGDSWWQQTVDAKNLTLLQRERRTLLEEKT